MRFATMVAAVCVLTVPAFAAKGGMAKGGMKDKGYTVKLKTSTGQDAGTAKFRAAKGDGVVVSLNLMNLTPGEHAVHIHEKPLCEAPDFKSAGGHFNPDNKQHGLNNPMGHHNGDLPQNVTVGADGTAKAMFTVDSISLKEGSMKNILANGGTAIMVHAKADDMVTDPTGGAGDRIACGVIVAPVAVPGTGQ